MQLCVPAATKDLVPSQPGARLSLGAQLRVWLFFPDHEHWKWGVWKMTLSEIGPGPLLVPTGALQTSSSPVSPRRGRIQWDRDCLFTENYLKATLNGDVQHYFVTSTKEWLVFS